MNNRAYTLVELLAIVAILGIISLVSAPNILVMVDNNKKDEMLQDAVYLISKAKTKVAGDRDFRNSSETTAKYFLKDLATTDEIDKDPDGGSYDRNNSYVLYSKSTGDYCVYLKGQKRSVARNDGALFSCAYEDQLYSRESVVKNS